MQYASRTVGVLVVAVSQTHTPPPRMQEEQTLIVREEQALLERLHAVLLTMDETDNQV